jgi:hypothetical protein
MDLITNAIEWVANDSGTALATLAPYGLLGLAGLYVLWLIVGWLRVSQVAIEQDGPGTRAVALLPRTPEGAATTPPPGVPYCPVDGLQYPPGARFCVQDESELLVACASCGATIRAADDSCYRCGTRATLASVSQH